MKERQPVEFEFATTYETEAYERWLRAKVQFSLHDPRPKIPQEGVMAEIVAVLAAILQQKCL